MGRSWIRLKTLLHRDQFNMKTGLVILLGLVALVAVHGVQIIRVPEDVNDLMSEKDGCTDSNGVFHALGSSYTSTDGCNTCNCMKGGLEGCTMMMCLPNDA